MAVKIRLTRMGAKSKPFYRIVAADADSPRDGKYLEILGNYDPKKKPCGNCSEGRKNSGVVVKRRQSNPDGS